MSFEKAMMIVVGFMIIDLAVIISLCKSASKADRMQEEKEDEG